MKSNIYKTYFIQRKLYSWLQMTTGNIMYKQNL